eukprot:7390829-Prymnesium_polylepis.1
MVDVEQWRAHIGSLRSSASSEVLIEVVTKQASYPESWRPRIDDLLLVQESPALPTFAEWLVGLPEERRQKSKEATAGLTITGVMSPPPAGSRNHCGFVVLILVLADLAAAKHVVLEELYAAWSGVPGLLPEQLHGLLSTIAALVKMPDSHARAAWAAGWFCNSSSWIAVDALRCIVPACLRPLICVGKAAVLDEFTIEDTDLDLAAADGEAVPVGVFATFVALFRGRVAIIAEYGGCVSRRDVGEGAELLCGMMVRERHMHYLPASEMLTPILKPSVNNNKMSSSLELASPQTKLSVVVHMHGSITAFMIDPCQPVHEINAMIDCACALSAEHRRLVLDGRSRPRIVHRSLGGQPMFRTEDLRALKGRRLHVLPWIRVGGCNKSKAAAADSHSVTSSRDVSLEFGSLPDATAEKAAAEKAAAEKAAAERAAAEKAAAVKEAAEISAAKKAWGGSLSPEQLAALHIFRAIDKDCSGS